MDIPPIQSFLFDKKGGVSIVSPGMETLGEDRSSIVWTHLKWEDPAGAKWLETSPKLSAEVIDALTAPETRPRCTMFRTKHGNGVVINLRGVNLHEDAEPEDMISIRIWLEQNRVVSAWRRPLFAVQDLIAGMELGQAPLSAGDFVARLALRLADRAEPVVAELNETVDGMEEKILAEKLAEGVRTTLADVRRTAIILRRYLFPQRDALSTLAIEDLPWLSEQDRSKLREATDRITRLAEELDAIRERAAVIQDQLVERRAAAMNKNMMVLAVVAAIFLPLGLLTGLLGINVGGIPGSDTSWAFWAVCGLLVITTLFQLWLYRCLKLM